jgi:hypothetical protein
MSSSKTIPTHIPVFPTSSAIAQALLRDPHETSNVPFEGPPESRTPSIPVFPASSAIAQALLSDSHETLDVSFKGPRKSPTPPLVLRHPRPLRVQRFNPYGPVFGKSEYLPKRAPHAAVDRLLQETLMKIVKIREEHRAAETPPLEGSFLKREGGRSASGIVPSRRDPLPRSHSIISSHAVAPTSHASFIR